MSSTFHRPIPGFRPSTPAVTSETITDVLAEHPAVAIHFWAEWNGVDPPMDQAIQEVMPTLAERIYFVSCNIDSPDNVPLCKRCNVASIPSLVVFVDGQQTEHIIGLTQPHELNTKLEKCLDNAES